MKKKFGNKKKKIIRFQDVENVLKRISNETPKSGVNNHYILIIK